MVGVGSTPAFGLNPVGRHVANKIVGMGIGWQIPSEGPKALVIIGSLPIKLTLLFDEATSTQSLVPLVKIIAFFHIAVLVLNHITLFKTQGCVIRITVHLADVDRAIPTVAQSLDPRMVPSVGVFENARGMRIIL